jgi:uncharacterized protein (TIGR00290 family)
MAMPIALLFSGGKDSVLALAALRALPELRFDALVTTFVTPDDQLSMHRVPRTLVELQAASLGARLVPVHVPDAPTNAQYEERLSECLLELKAQGVEGVAAGDLFLTDIRAYRERFFAKLGLAARFPLWGQDTGLLAREFVDAGYRSVLVCVDNTRLDRRFAGIEMSRELLQVLPSDVDPCGENGEFHSFVYDGPGFAFPVRFEHGGTTSSERFTHATLTPLPADRCAQCGAPFDCAMTRGDGQCWCVALPKIAPNPALSSCLCPRCLVARAAP